MPPPSPPPVGVGASRYVGVDLAWGERSPTGLAVLDEDGRLLDLAAVRTDEEILERLAGPTAGPCVVAVDAPVVVTNATGRRPAEAALTADFARFHAGTHVANTGIPWLREPRAARLAALLGVPVDDDNPDRSGRRLVEVYPHAAIVALGGLDRILGYKSKRGRTLPGMRGELLRLLDLLEALDDPPLRLGGPPWAGVREAVTTAPTKAALRRTEDPVDAVVCADVALLLDRSPERVRAYGEPSTGQIWTPYHITRPSSMT